MNTNVTINLMKKGKYNEKCNRTDCDNHNATFYNYSTKKYYCSECAVKINEHNHFDALKMYGHELCIDGEYKESEEEKMDPDVERLIGMFSETKLFERYEEHKEILQLANVSTYDNKPTKLKKGLSVIHTSVRTIEKIGRNDKCTCGSEKKYKHCCGK